eukprot:TRINITY_DN76557_c0_g1_i1.p1 TRINITY_DN76557_c0_g1~~TRINITY_DN76557_c0_g1_i1.p1  ORF type:complete len:604 (+),score=104.50 TRINITY_DN76557_c0_g1_i1:330-2141(+)
MGSRGRVRRQEWSNHHHVVTSCGNSVLPKCRRAYFDDLPTIIRKGGELTNCLVLQQKETDSATEFEFNLDRRTNQFPQFAATPVRCTTPTGTRSRTASSIASPESTWRSVSSGATSRSIATKGSPKKSDTPKGRRPDSKEIFAAIASKADWSTRAGAAAALRENLQVGLGNLPAVSAGSLPLETTCSSREGCHRELDEIAGASASAEVGQGRGTVTFERQDSSEKRCIMQESGPVADLNKWCESKRMNLVSLWRKLDRDGTMNLYKREFVLNLKNLNYPNDLELLWQCIDRDHTGIVSFLEFAPEDALDLARLKVWATDLWGGIGNMFEVMDFDRNGKVTFAEFAETCMREGLPGKLNESLKTLFLLLDSDNLTALSKNVITKDELKFLDVWVVPPYLYAKPDFDAMHAFKRALSKLHQGNPFLAWRKSIDRDGSMRVSYEEFIIACKALTRTGTPEATPPDGRDGLFCAFDEDRSGWFSFFDWDADSYRYLSAFTMWAREEFGKPSAFVRGSEKNLNEGVSMNVFAKCTKEVSMDRSKLWMLFEGLSKGKPKIFTNDLVFLDSWDPEKEAQEELAWEEMALSRMDIQRNVAKNAAMRQSICK